MADNTGFSGWISEAGDAIMKKGKPEFQYISKIIGTKQIVGVTQDCIMSNMIQHCKEFMKNITIHGRREVSFS